MAPHIFITDESAQLNGFCKEECTPNRQLELMSKARASATFDTFELTCLLFGGKEMVKRKREAFERVENLTGTRDTLKLPRCYANQNRQEAFDEGLEWGKAAFEDGLPHKHNFFDYATPRYQLVNSR